MNLKGVQMRFLVPALLLTGCGSFTSFQTARSMEFGHFSVEGTAAAVALSAGSTVGVRSRFGLGQGFEAGLEMNAVGGAATAPLMTTADVKYQILSQKTGAPFSVACDVGAGTGLVSQFYYGQVIISADTGGIEPYLAYRYQRIDLQLDPNDPDDRDDLLDSILKDVFEEADSSDIRLHHIFLGGRLDLGRGFYLIPEVSFIAGDATGLGSVGVGFGFEW